MRISKYVSKHFLDEANCQQHQERPTYDDETKHKLKQNIQTFIQTPLNILWTAFLPVL